MSSKASEERILRTLRQSCQKDPNSTTMDVLDVHELTLSRPSDIHSGHVVAYTAKGAELLVYAGYFVHHSTHEQVLQVRDYWKNLC